ncbi:MAG: MauE/DoxX family redox-associated membrane protein [Labedaea sp.]
MNAELVLAVRVLVGLVFGVAAVSKLGSRRGLSAFAMSLTRLGPRPVRGWFAVAVGTAVTELTVAILVALPPTYRVGLTLAAAVLLVFCVAIGYSIRRERRIECRCFGGSGAVLGRPHLIRNTILAVLASAGAIVHSAAPADFQATAAAVLIGAFAGAVAIYWDALTTTVGLARR